MIPHIKPKRFRHQKSEENPLIEMPCEILETESLETYWIKEETCGVEIIRTKSNNQKYHVIEPKLSPFEKELLNITLKESRNILAKKSAEKTKDELFKTADKILSRHKITDATRDKIRYYLETTVFGWGRLEVLRLDKNIEDISCVGINHPVYIYHRKYRDMETDIFFETEDELDNAVTLFAQKAGKQISLSNPIIDGTLPGGSRIQITYGSAVSARGTSFTIRKFKEVPYSVIDLIQNRTFTVEEMVYLWFAVEYNHSILIIGGTASGKTTTLNALSQFIPPLSKIVTLEDTQELMLCHGNWMPSVVPPGRSRENITLFDLVTAAMRQRPEYLIVGEVRGKETSALFQAINTGHTTLSTFHAGNLNNAINRLENPPLSVPRAMISSLDIILTQKRIVKDGVQIRRITDIEEISNGTELNVSKVFSYIEKDDCAVFLESSKVYSDILSHTGMTKDEFEAEAERRKRLLYSMAESGVTDFQTVSSVISDYMTGVLDEIETKN